MNIQPLSEIFQIFILHLGQKITTHHDTQSLEEEWFQMIV